MTAPDHAVLPGCTSTYPPCLSALQHILLGIAQTAQVIPDLTLRSQHLARCPFAMLVVHPRAMLLVHKEILVERGEDALRKFGVVAPLLAIGDEIALPLDVARTLR